MDEEHPLQGQSPYSASKIGADKLAEAFHLSFELPVAVIRPFNTFGPRQSARAVIPTIITQALTQSEVRLGSLDPTRDFNYVADTVEGFVKMAECPKAIGEVINIGSGEAVSIGEVAAAIIEIMGKDIPILSDDQRVRPVGSEVQDLQSEISKAQRILGWSPKYTLRKGLAETIRWIEGNLERYRPNIYAT
jgi:nucleoside-diphosphate-sugar epimerase